MHGPAHWAWGYCPVRWLNRHALVALPERVEESNAKPVSEQLLSILNSDVLVLILDMTGTAACDHAGGEALNRVYQRAMASGTELGPVVTDEGVRRVLTMTGVGRLVRVYANMAGAMAATKPGDNIALDADRSPGRAWEKGPVVEDVGTEVALLDRDGVIVSVNGAWRAFAAANGGDPARTGPGMSYFDICAASGDRVSDQVASAIRDALAGHLPDSLTVELPCHSPRTERWFDTLISSRRDDRGRILGATVTLSLTRAQTRVLLPDRAGRPAGLEADAAFVGEVTERLAGVGRILEQSAAEACSNLAGQLHRALGELDAVIKDVRTAVGHRQPGPEA
jgi:anti-anti-sigma regulatory factor